MVRLDHANSKFSKMELADASVMSNIWIRKAHRKPLLLFTAPLMVTKPSKLSCTPKKMKESNKVKNSPTCSLEIFQPIIPKNNSLNFSNHSVQSTLPQSSQREDQALYHTKITNQLLKQSKRQIWNWRSMDKLFLFHLTFTKKNLNYNQKTAHWTQLSKIKKKCSNLISTLNSFQRASLNKKLRRNSAKQEPFSQLSLRTTKQTTMVKNSRAIKSDTSFTRMSNVHKNASNSSINQDASVTTRSLLRSISGRLKMIWSKQDTRNKEITSPSSSILSSLKANKVNLMDQVACKWVDNSHTMDKTKVVRWMTARWTWEAAAEVVIEDSKEDAEEADKITVVETNKITEVAHNSNRDTVKTKSPREWWVKVWTNLRWLQDNHQWCLDSNSQWVKWTQYSNLHSSNNRLSKTPCNFLRSMLPNLMHSWVMREITLLETISICQLCRPSVKNLPQPLPVCFLMRQLSISSSCFPKTNTSSPRPERPTNFLFRARTNSSKKVDSNNPFLKWDNSESHELEPESKLLYIRTGTMSSTIFLGTVNKDPTWLRDTI